MTLEAVNTLRKYVDKKNTIENGYSNLLLVLQAAEFIKILEFSGLLICFQDDRDFYLNLLFKHCVFSKLNNENLDDSILNWFLTFSYESNFLDTEILLMYYKILLEFKKWNLSSLRINQFEIFNNNNFEIFKSLIEEVDNVLDAPVFVESIIIQLRDELLSSACEFLTSIDNDIQVFSSLYKKIILIDESYSFNELFDELTELRKIVATITQDLVNAQN